MSDLSRSVGRTGAVNYTNTNACPISDSELQVSLP